MLCLTERIRVSCEEKCLMNCGKILLIIDLQPEINFSCGPSSCAGQLKVRSASSEHIVKTLACYYLAWQHFGIKILHNILHNQTVTLYFGTDLSQETDAETLHCVDNVSAILGHRKN